MLKNLAALAIAGLALAGAQALDSDPHALGGLFQDPVSVPGLTQARPDATRPLPPLWVDHSAQMPPVRSQGSLPSCTAWAFAYYYKTYQEWLEHGWSVNDSNHQFSPGFVYNHANRGGNLGCYASDAMKVLTDFGVPTLAEMPYDQSSYTYWPAESVYFHALAWRCATGYYIDCRTDPGIVQLKQHLASGDNAVLGMYVWSNFDNINNFDTTYCVADKYGSNRGGHYVCIVGYDDEKQTHDGPGAVRIVNSWGTGWGNRGYAWMSYAAVKDVDLSWRWTCYLDDKIAYRPALVTRARFTHDCREGIEVRAGIGPADNPVWSKPFLNWSLGIGGTNPFPAHNLVFDLTDGLGYLSPDDTNPVFVQCQDIRADGITGTLDAFAGVNNDWGAYSLSPQPPVAIPDDRTWAGLDMNMPGRRIAWSCFRRFPFHSGASGRGGDLDTVTTLWTFPTDYSVTSSPALADLDGDGRLEVAFGSDDCLMRVLSGENGGLVWSETLPDFISPSPAIGDLDGDGNLDVVFADEAGWAAARRGFDGYWMWIYQIPGVASSSPCLGDLDGDGDLDIVVCANLSRGEVLARHGLTGTPFWAFLAQDEVNSSPAIADVNGDGRLEVVVGSDDGRLYVLKGATGESLWSHVTGGLVEASPAIADVNGDGRLEIVVGSFDHNLYCLRGDRDSVLWSFTAGGRIYSSPAVADINQDSLPEIAFGCDDSLVYCVGHDGSLLWTYPTRDWVRASPAIADIDGDGVAEVTVGSLDGNLYCLNSEDGSLCWSYSTGGGIESSPAVGDIDNDGWLEVVFGSQDRNLHALSGRHVSGAAEPLPGTARRAELNVGPNPFGQNLTISYYLPEAGPVRLAVYDRAGREQAVLVNRVQPAGRHRTSWAADAGMPNGVYFLEARLAGTELFRKLVRTR